MNYKRRPLRIGDEGPITINRTVRHCRTIEGRNDSLMSIDLREDRIESEKVMIIGQTET